MRNLRKLLLASAMMLTMSVMPPFAAEDFTLSPNVPGHVPGTIVVDATGKFVGLLISAGTIERVLNGILVDISVQKEGFASYAPALYYTTTNCSGTAYHLADNLPVLSFFVPDTVVLGQVYYGSGTLYFPGKLQTLITVMSTLFPGPPPFCQSGNGGGGGSGTIYAVSTLQSVKLSFTPPFTLQ